LRLVLSGTIPVTFRKICYNNSQVEFGADRESMPIGPASGSIVGAARYS
jgi:hypothetical protein